MLFGKKKTADVIFKKHYTTMLKIANSSPAANNAEFELLPAMFIVSDYAAASSGKDRRLIANLITKEITKIHKDYDKHKFDRRCDLYGEIIRRKRLRCEWFLGNDPSPFYENAISKCVALLGDILYNPECADDYDNAPMMIGDIFIAMNYFTETIKPLMNVFIELFEDIYSLQPASVY